MLDMPDHAFRWKHILGAAAVLSLCACAALPTEQQAVVQLGGGGTEVLHLQTIPVQSPGTGQVLVRVFAVGVNPHDWKFRQQPPNKVPLRIVPGMDVAGVIAALGPDVSGFKVGDAVFGTSGEFNPDGSTLNGAYSQYVVMPAANVAPKPSTLTYEQAAGLGLIAWIAGRAMDDAKLHPGERVLITGAAGGVGSAAVQIAVSRGAHVIATASPTHFDYLKSLGVSEVVDYHDPDWIKRVGQVDMALETVGGPTATITLNALGNGGTFITTNPSSVTKEQYTAAASAGVTAPQAKGGPRPPPGPYLSEVAELVRAGKFTVHVDRSYPLAQAAQAQDYGEAGHTEGKIVLVVTDKAQSR
jgi:NADPH:quinone reductase-like Zn-dependent oxidoreductase